MCAPVTFDGRFARMCSGTTFSPRRLHRVDEIEAVDAVVVLGLRLDVDFLEPRHRRSVAGSQDAHVGRPILEHADEVLGVAGLPTPSRSASATRYESVAVRSSATPTAGGLPSRLSASGLPSPSVIWPPRRTGMSV